VRRMIHDRIEHLSRYALPGGNDILAFLRENPALSLPLMEREIKGRELFVRPAQYTSRLPEEGRFETHRLYMDVQYVLSGAERMQSAPPDTLTPATDEDPVNDVRFFGGGSAITDVIVRSGEFVVYFPGEAHRPMCQRGLGPETVRKLVFKVKWNAGARS